MLADFHVHSNFSDDSVYEAANVARDAYEQGIEALCSPTMWITASSPMPVRLLGATTPTMAKESHRHRA